MKFYFMRKLFLSMLAAVTLFASCSEEELVSKTGGESLINFTVTTPELGSRAATMGNGSSATDLYYAVYDETANEIVTAISKTESAKKETIKVGTVKEITLSLLNGHKYSLVFWATNDNGAYAIDWDNKSISLKDASALVSNNENYDAFYAYVEPFIVTGVKQSTVEMKRPFAQLNIGTAKTDLEGVASYYGVTGFTHSSIVVTTPTAMDLTTGNVSDEEELTFAAASFISSEKLKENYEYLSMNYLLVSNEKSLVDVQFSISTTDKAISKTFENIPVQRNYKTNIYGNLFTSATSWNVELKPGFENTDNNLKVYTVSTEAELKEAAKTGAFITLTNDIVLTSDLSFTNNVEINGQGYEINGRRIIFTGEVVSLRNTKFIGAAADTYEASNVYVQGNNKIFVAEDCEFSNSEYEGIQYTSENATSVTINNCIFKTNVDIARAIHLQLKDASDAQVVITNNKIYNGNLYNKNSDKDIVCVYGFAAANMTLEGNVVYDVTALDDEFIWISDGKSDTTIGTDGFELGGNSVSSSADLATVFASANKVTLSDNVAISSNISIADGKEFDGAGNTLFMDNMTETGGLALGLTVAGGEIKNLNIDGQNQASVNNKGYRAIFIVNPQQDVVIDNVNIKGVLYPLNTGDMATAAAGTKLSVANSTLEGWTSFAGLASAEFTGCNFGIGTYYPGEAYANSLVKPYVTTVFENCDFEKGYYIDLSSFAGDKVTFKNCTVDGVALTEAMFENITVTSNPIPSNLPAGKSLWYEEGATAKFDKIIIE